MRPKSSAFQAVVKIRTYIRRSQLTIFGVFFRFFLIIHIIHVKHSLLTIHLISMYFSTILMFDFGVVLTVWYSLFFILSIIVEVVVLRLLDLQLLCNQCLSSLMFPPSIKVTATI